MARPRRGSPSSAAPRQRQRDSGADPPRDRSHEHLHARRRRCGQADEGAGPVRGLPRERGGGRQPRVPVVRTGGVGLGRGCAMPNLAGRELVWTGVVGVETLPGVTVSYGYFANSSIGSLSDTTFTLGTTTYTIKQLSVNASARLIFSLTADLPTSATAVRSVHVCDEAFHFGTARDATPGTRPTAGAMPTVPLVLLGPRLVLPHDPAPVSQPSRHDRARAPAHRRQWGGAHHDVRRGAQGDAAGRSIRARTGSYSGGSGRGYVRVHGHERPGRCRTEPPPDHHDPGPACGTRADDQHDIPTQFRNCGEPGAGPRW